MGNNKILKGGMAGNDTLNEKVGAQNCPYLSFPPQGYCRSECIFTLLPLYPRVGGEGIPYTIRVYAGCALRAVLYLQGK